MSRRDLTLAMGTVLALLLAGCGSKGSEKPPVPQVTPEAILFPDITQGKLYGSGCNFVPAGGGMGAYALALDSHAWIKLDGKIVTLDPDTASTPMPQKGWSRYVGDKYTLTLTRDEGAPDKRAGLIDLLKGTLSLTNAKGKVVYRAKGDIQCKPM